MPSGRSPALPYTPAPPPEGAIARAVWDEFYRIAELLAQMDRPFALSLICSGDTINVGVGSPAFARLFDVNTTITWEQPQGMFDTGSGVWTVVSEGLWQMLATITVQPFAVPGNREYSVELRATVTPADGGPVVVRTIVNSALDTQFLATTLPILLPLFRGDLVVFDARAIVSSGSSGTTPVTCRLQLHRVSGVR